MSLHFHKEIFPLQTQQHIGRRGFGFAGDWRVCTREWDFDLQFLGKLGRNDDPVSRHYWVRNDDH